MVFPLLALFLQIWVISEMGNLFVSFFFPLESNNMVICPSRDLGTNALLISPPDGITFYYGKDSFQKHLEIANRNKIKTTVLKLKSLTFDIDVMEDLQELLIEFPDFLGNGDVYNE